MQSDFHYNATYCAAFLAGFSHEECLVIAHSAALVDHCTKTLLSRIKAPLSGATSQLSMELMDMRTDLVGLQEITRIWTPFHFLPYNLYAEKPNCSRRYLQKYRLICDVNGELVVDTVNLAANSSLEAIGIAMHAVADTWAHRYFVGTPSLVINDINHHFYELIPDGNGGFTEKRMHFRHNPTVPDDPVSGNYTATFFRFDENSVMNLGHARAGHIHDYSFARIKYMPAWAGYNVVYKDNPTDFYCAFGQMTEALLYLNGRSPAFETGRYAAETLAPYDAEIRAILEKRQNDCSADWRALGERLSGGKIVPFDTERYLDEYVSAPADGKDNTFMGRYVLAALAQKSMVTNKIYRSGNMLAGYSVDYNEKGLQGIKDFFKLIELRQRAGGERDE